MIGTQQEVASCGEDGTKRNEPMHIVRIKVTKHLLITTAAEVIAGTCPMLTVHVNTANLNPDPLNSGAAAGTCPVLRGRL